MKSVKVFSIVLIGLLLLIGCGSTQLSKNMELVSTNSKLALSDDYKSETKRAEVSTFYIFGIPLGDEASAVAAFNKLNQDATYVNNLKLVPKGWDFKFETDEGIKTFTIRNGSLVSQFDEYVPKEKLVISRSEKDKSGKTKYSIRKVDGVPF